MDNPKEIEKLIDSLMSSDKLETPSIGFTQNVLEKTVKVKTQKITHKPLLPKWILVFAVILVIGLVIYGIDLNTSSDTTVSYLKDLDKVGIWFSNFFAQLNFSKTLTYAVAISSLMICFHTLILKKYFENRLA